MKNVRHIFFLIIAINLQWVNAYSQMGVRLFGLSDMIKMAQEKSVQAKVAKSAYRQSVLAYEIYKANNKPSLVLTSTPGKYNRNIVQRYVSETNQDEYRTQQAFYSSGRLAVNQKVGFTGGNVYLYSDLGVYRSLGHDGYAQFTSVPLGFGYSQQLLGYNPYKWEKLIANEQMQLAEKQLTYSMEEVAISAGSLYYEALLYQKQIELSHQYLHLTDTILKQGSLLESVGKLTRSDLLLLRFENSKAERRLIEAQSRYDLAIRKLSDFAGIDVNEKFRIDTLELPDPINLHEAEALSMALNNSPMIRERTLSVLSARQELDKAKKQRYAEVSVDLTVGLNQTARSFANAYRSPMRQDVVSVGLSIPLVDWGVRKRSVKKADEETQVAMWNKEDAAKQMHRDVAELLSNYNILYKASRLTQENVVMAHMLQKESYERFILGRESLELLLQANRSVEEAEYEYIRAITEYWDNYLHLRQYTLFDWINGVFLSYKSI